MELSSAQLAQFERDGLLIFRDFLAAEEIDIIRAEIERVSKIDDPCVFREGEAGQAKTMFRMHELDAPTGSAAVEALSRMPKAVRPAQQVLGSDALYYHHVKINMKAAIEGTAWPWHQDFGTWNVDGVLRPDMVTLGILISDATEANGCLYFLPGSHRSGRVKPIYDKSTGYSLWAVPPSDVRSSISELGNPVAFSGKAGDAALFHCNLYHASGHNVSAHDRWQAYLCFNRSDNHPEDVDNPRPHYVRSTDWTPIEMGNDEDLLSTARARAVPAE